MKRLLLTLLLAVLPLQISWAMVAPYCQHEETPMAQHFGHHAHKHQASSDTPEDKGNPTKVCNDCGFCHLSSSMKSTLIQPAQIVFFQGSTYIDFLPPIYSSHILDGPERPNQHPAS